MPFGYCDRSHSVVLIVRKVLGELYLRVWLSKYNKTMNKVQPSKTRSASLKKSWKSLPAKVKTQRRKQLALVAKKGLENAWTNPTSRKLLTEERKERANKPKEKQRLKKMANNLWASSKGVEMREALKARWQNPEYRKKMIKKFAKANKGKPSWNAGLNKDNYEPFKKLSEARMGQTPKRGFRCWYRGPKGRIEMKSTWELAYAKYLDAKGIDWQYEPRWFNIGKGNWRGNSYTPDFYLPGSRHYVEIKGHVTAAVLMKLRKMKRQYPTVVINLIDGPVLQALGVI